ncbi:MAG: hypothetical protein NWR22_04165, partial [Saprospiraceae bacterium]|nr:hypothetical protein [Saprospiraceae bacterium]
MILFYKGKYSVANKNKPFLFFWYKGYSTKVHRLVKGVLTNINSDRYAAGLINHLSIFQDGQRGR